MSGRDSSGDLTRDLARVRVIVTGRVQGVFFRASAATEAQALGIVGYVRNRADLSVEIVAEADRGRLEQLCDWALVGPPRARVDEIRTEWSTATGEFSGFTIR
jgi:acylphosphatase